MLILPGKSASWTGAAFSATEMATQAGAGVGSSFTISGVSFGAAEATREILVYLSAHFGTSAPSSGDYTCTVDGNSATEVYFYPAPSRFTGFIVWKVALPTGASGDVVISRVSGTSDFFAHATTVLRLTGNPTLDTAVTDDNTVQNQTLTVTQTVGAGSALICGVSSRDGPTVTPTGATLSTNQGGFAQTFFDTGLSSGSRTITFAISGESGAFHKSAISMEIIP